jgi:hypothetical protein
VRKGLHQFDEGRGVAHERVRKEFAEWLTPSIVSHAVMGQQRNV